VRAPVPAPQPAKALPPAPAPRPPVVPAGVRLLPIVPPQPPAATPAPIRYSDPRCTVIRALYDNGMRPGTGAMRRAIIEAGLSDASDGTIRGALRAEVEHHEPHLAQLPPAPVRLTG